MVNQDSDQKLESELRIVRRLLALSLIDGKKQREQIKLLAAAGMDRHEIAELVGTTAGTVSVEMSNLRKHGAPRRGRRT
jgi:CRP-like cAMP-binding protein